MSAVSVGGRRGCGSPEDGGTGDCELTYLGAGVEFRSLARAVRAVNS